MSEHLQTAERHEIHHSPEELLVATPEHKARPKPRHEANPAHKAAKAREQVRNLAEQASQPQEKIEAAVRDSQPVQPLNVTRELKAITLRREIKSIQRKLSTPQRTLSKVVHQPAVRLVSETAGKTVSRPSGILGGSLVAFFGTSAYYLLAKDVGFSYNYLVFLALFVGGFLVGVALEFVVYLATASHRRAND